MPDDLADGDDVVERHLRRYGFWPAAGDLDQVRAALARDATRVRDDEDDVSGDLMRLCCVQLFNAGVVSDALLIWDAKMANFDTACGLDIQFLCGAGLDETKAFLAAQADVPKATDALEYLLACEAARDFEDFTVAGWTARYARYFGLEQPPGRSAPAFPR